MVVIAGDVPTHYYGKHPHQEVNLHADARAVRDLPAVRETRLARRFAELFPEIIEKAFPLAESGQPGPVLVDVPMDIFSQEIDVELFARLRHNAKTLRQTLARRRDREEIVRALCRSQDTRCSTSAVASCSRRRRPRLRELRRSPGDPGRPTLMGKGALPDDHPLVLGMTGFWGTKFINDTVPAAPTGCSASAHASRRPTAARGSGTTRSTFPPTKLIHIDIEPGRDRPQFSDRDRRRGRSQAGAQGAEPGRAQNRSRACQRRERSWREIGGFRARVRGQQPQAMATATRSR